MINKWILNNLKSIESREEANSVIEQMAERGIACNVHYKPLPMMTAYKALGFDIKDYPNGKNGADCYSKNGHAVTVLTVQS